MEVLIAAGVLGFGLLAWRGSSSTCSATPTSPSSGAKPSSSANRRSRSLCARTDSASTSGSQTSPTPSNTVTGQAPSYAPLDDGEFGRYQRRRRHVPGLQGRQDGRHLDRPVQHGESITLNSIIAMSDPATAGRRRCRRRVRRPESRRTAPSIFRGRRSSSAMAPAPFIRSGLPISGGDAICETHIQRHDRSRDIFVQPCDACPAAITHRAHPPTRQAGGARPERLSAGGLHRRVQQQSPPINFHISVAPVANATLFGCFDDIGASVGNGTQQYTGYVSYNCVINTANSNGAWSGSTTYRPDICLAAGDGELGNVKRELVRVPL